VRSRRREREHATDLRAAREAGEAEREAAERREAARRWGCADGGKGSLPAPVATFEPSSPNAYAPRG
jgi:hypothetical protein